MAVNKVVNSKTKSRGAMRNAIEYVLREDKVRDGLAVVTGPYAPGEVTWDGVYNAFLQEKKLWGKETGRMYAHNVISFHRDEAVTPEQCLEIGMRFAGKFFPHHQSLVGVHQDRNHLHLHVVTNSVSFADGKKLHQTKRDLEKQKEFTNALCGKMGLTVTEKGKHFDGSSMETGEVTAWSKDKYNLFARNGGKSYVAECARAVKKVSAEACDREDFASGMLSMGWKVLWSDERKHVTFQNENGDRVRDGNLSRTFAMNVSKEGLTSEFKRNCERKKLAERRRQFELERLDGYYREIEEAVLGAGPVGEAVGGDQEAAGRAGGEQESAGQARGRSKGIAGPEL